MRPDTDYADSLRDLLLETNLSVREIAEELERSEVEVRKDIKRFGLDWVMKTRAGSRTSRGQVSLTNVVKKLLPGVEVVNEEYIGDKLRLDIYVPKFKLGIEYHGRQHFDYVEFFHGDIYGFQDSLRRDGRKYQICKDLGITLVVFRYTDALDEDSVYARLLEAIKNAPTEETVKPAKKKTTDLYYEVYKQRQREYRKQAYQKMKKRGRC